jgi:uncharacterized protein (DUF433 family)
MATKMKSDLFTRREAAILADVSLNTVDKAIEEKVVKARRSKAATLLAGDDVIVIAMIGNAGLPLQRKAKREIRRWVHEVRPHISSKTEELLLGDLIVLRPDQHVRAIAKQLEHYGEGRERFIESKPDVMGGEPVIAGTRLPARAVAERVKRGDSIEDLREDYPHVPRQAFDAALVYAQSHPRRGRPARPWREL